jgi:mannose-6-phosphate isomerase-like protein (cupin superfamily)
VKAIEDIRPVSQVKKGINLVSPAPGSVPIEAARLKLWGDDTSGRVNDWIYVSNERIQHMVFSMAPGTRFGHSESFRTRLGADELYYVLSGTLVLANPQTGEVHRVEKGEALRFGRDTWHHGFSYGPETLRVLEFFAPPPAMGASQLYARTKPYLDSPTYVQDEWIGRWPEASAEAAAPHTQHLISKDEILWRMEGEEHPILVGIYLSTDELTAGSVELLPGQWSDTMTHGGDEAGLVLEGTLNLFLPDHTEIDSGKSWFEMGVDDGFFVPAGMPHRYYNMTDRTVRFMFGVAPTYLANGG